MHNGVKFSGAFAEKDPRWVSIRSGLATFAALLVE